MAQSCLFLQWHYPSSGLILEIGRNKGSYFYFLEDEYLRGPFDSFFDNGKIIEFHSCGIFFQFFINTKKWHVVTPRKSFILKYEEVVEINNLLFISEQIFKTIPIC